MLYLREYRPKADRLFDHLPWVALIGPGLVLNKDGSFQKTLAFRGPDLASATDADWRGDRLLTDVPVLDDPVTTLLAALVRGGSLVLVHDASPTSWTSRSSEERATDVRRLDGRS